jgi:hypothetical protein
MQIYSCSIASSWIWCVKWRCYSSHALLIQISAIPTVHDGGNHTPFFEQAAATTAAHYACLDVSKALAATGVRVLLDDSFFAKVFSLGICLSGPKFN